MKALKMPQCCVHTFKEKGAAFLTLFFYPYPAMWAALLVPGSAPTSVVMLLVVSRQELLTEHIAAA